MKQEPRGELHQPGGEPHAFGRIGQRSRALKLFRLLPARSVEIRRGLFNQSHAVTEQVCESLRTGEPLTKRYRLRFVQRLFGHDTPHTYAERIRAPYTNE